MSSLRLQEFNFSDASSQSAPAVDPSQQKNAAREVLRYAMNCLILGGQVLTLAYAALEAVSLIYPYLLVLGVAYAVASRTRYKDFANTILDKAQKLINNNINIIGMASAAAITLSIIFRMNISNPSYGSPTLGARLWYIFENTTLAAATIWAAKINDMLAHVGITSTLPSVMEQATELYNQHAAPKVEKIKQKLGLANKDDSQSGAPITQSDAPSAAAEVVTPEAPESRDWQLAGAAAVVTAHAFAASTLPAAGVFSAPLIPAFLLIAGATAGKKVFEEQGARETLATTLAGTKPVGPR